METAWAGVALLAIFFPELCCWSQLHWLKMGLGPRGVSSGRVSVTQWGTGAKGLPTTNVCQMGPSSTAVCRHRSAGQEALQRARSWCKAVHRAAGRGSTSDWLREKLRSEAGCKELSVTFQPATQLGWEQHPPSGASPW